MNYWGMAKNISNAKIIVESDFERYEFDTPSASISSVDGGRTHFLNTTDLYDMKKFPIAAVPATPKYSVDFYPYKPSKPAEEANLISAARAQERAQLKAARLIEKAHEQAEAVINDADHTLNLSIQDYLHTGKTADEVARVLDRAGIYYNEVRGQNVATLNTPDLYLLDGTELLTVG